jgi:hypothetical protein
MTQNRVEWQTLVSTVTKRRIPYRQIVSTIWAPTSFSRYLVLLYLDFNECLSKRNQPARLRNLSSLPPSLITHNSQPHTPAQTVFRL